MYNYNPGDIFNSLSLIDKITTTINSIDKEIRNKLLDIYEDIAEGDYCFGDSLDYGKYIKYLDNAKAIYYGLYFDLLNTDNYKQIIDNSPQFSSSRKTLEKELFSSHKTLKKELDSSLIKQITSFSEEFISHIEEFVFCVGIHEEYIKKNDKEHGISNYNNGWYYFPIDRKILTKDNFNEDLKEEVVKVITSHFKPNIKKNN